MLDTDSTLDVLRGITKDVVPEVDLTRFTADRRLADLGCNSIDRAEILTVTMDRLGVVIPSTELHSELRIGDLVTLFQRYA
jgi:polyketide biosynthesis acyl carrier protein